MRALIKDLFKPKSVLGCDIGGSSVKFVMLKENKGQLFLESLGMIEADVFASNAVGMNRIRAYIREHGLAGQRAGINIEDKSMRIRRMDLPQMPKGDLKIAIRWNFREYVDGQIDKYTVDYSDFGDMKVNGDKRPILAFAVSNESINNLLKISRQIGLKPAVVEPNATAMLAAFDLNIGWEQGKYSVMIDMRRSLANFIAVGNGSLLFSRPLSNAGMDNLVKNIARDMGAPAEQAEAYLKAHQSKTAAEGEIAAKVQASVGLFLSQMVVDIQRSIDAFCLMFHVDKVDSIYLSGGGSLLPGINEYLSKNLGIATSYFNPFAKIDASKAEGGIANPQLYAVAVGLAIPRG